MNHTKKKLAIFITSMGKGGAEKIVSVLVNYLKTYFDISLVLLRDEIVYSIPNDINIVYLDDKTNKSFFYKLFSILPLAFKYKRFCKDNQIDVSLSLLSSPNFISLLSKLIGNKVDTYISEHIALSSWRKSEKIYSYILKMFVKLFYPLAEKIIVVSKIIKLDLQNSYNIADDKIVVIYNPHDLEFINVQKQQKISLIDTKKTLISIGTLNERKGFHYLIEAMSKLQNENVQLLILGDGELRNKLTEMVDRLNLKDSVYFLGFQSNPYAYLHNSDIFVLASDNEGLPNVIIEALACECAVVSTDCISGPREILAPNSDITFQQKEMAEKEEFGFLTPIYDVNQLAIAIQQLLDNPEELSLYKQKGLIRANDFALHKQCEEYLKVLMKGQY